MSSDNENNKHRPYNYALQFGVFAGLDAALLRLVYDKDDSNNNNNIPRRDFILTLVAVLVVLAVSLASTVVGLRPSRRSNKRVVVALNKSDRFKKVFPLLSLSELVVFLVVPWALLVFGGGGGSTPFRYVLSSHLLHVQTQIALEAVVIMTTGFDDEGGGGGNCRHRRRFEYVAATNLALRGAGIATWMARYVEVRRATGRGDYDYFYYRLMMDAYSVVALLLWLAANAAIFLVWYPCLSTEVVARETGGGGGLRTYEDAVAIVTGAASGIGRAVAENVAERGAMAVVLVDRQKALADEVAARIKGLGAESAVYEVDVREYDQLKRVADETKRNFGRIDYLFNNAGILIIGPIEEIGVENFNYILDVNVKGIHNGVQAVYPIMKEQGFGHIVNTSSLLGLIPGGQWAVAYSTTKHAIVGLTTNLRIEAAKYGIFVSLFCPGTIDTPIHSGGKYGKNMTGIPKDLWDKQLSKMRTMDANTCAARTLDAVAENKSIIIVPELPMITSRLLYRLSPSLWLERAVSKVDWRKGLQRKAAGGVKETSEEKKDD